MLVGRHADFVFERPQPLEQPTASNAVFGCELRFFDRSKNANRGVPCYAPATIRAAYGLTDLIASGSDGRGRTASTSPCRTGSAT
jgi:hypothetical protein